MCSFQQQRGWIHTQLGGIELIACWEHVKEPLQETAAALSFCFRVATEGSKVGLCLRQLAGERAVETHMLPQSTCVCTALQQRGVGEVVHVPLAVLTSLFSGAHQGDVLHFGAVSGGPALLRRGPLRCGRFSSTQSCDEGRAVWQEAVPESLSTEQAILQISQAVLAKFGTFCCFKWPLRAQVIYAGPVKKLVILGQRSLQNQAVRLQREKTLKGTNNNNVLGCKTLNHEQSARVEAAALQTVLHLRGSVQPEGGVSAHCGVELLSEELTADVNPEEIFLGSRQVPSRVRAGGVQVESHLGRSWIDGSIFPLKEFTVEEHGEVGHPRQARNGVVTRCLQDFYGGVLQLFLMAAALPGFVWTRRVEVGDVSRAVVSTKAFWLGRCL